MYGRQVVLASPGADEAQGGKRVYLAHDMTLDSDVSFAVIKTQNLVA